MKKENIVEIKNLNKSFGEVKAVSDLSFSVKKGELFAFLGVNGAGKSTTISIMCGQLEKDGGEVFISGKNINTDMMQVKKQLGVVFQNSVLDKVLTVRENLLTRASLYGITGKEFENRLREVSDMLDLKDIINRRVGKLSGGQRRRADIARAILHKPQILILDEPTTGLDPQTRQKVWQVINYLRKQENITVLLTTHYMEEAADSDYVIIIDAGHLVAEGTPLTLKNEFAGDYVTFYNVDESQIKKLNFPYEKLRDGFRVKVKNTAEATTLVKKHPDLFVDYEITKGKMDDVFLSVTGKKLYAGENK